MYTDRTGQFQLRLFFDEIFGQIHWIYIKLVLLWAWKDGVAECEQYAWRCDSDLAWFQVEKFKCTPSPFIQFNSLNIVWLFFFRWKNCNHWKNKILFRSNNFLMFHNSIFLKSSKVFYLKSEIHGLDDLDFCKINAT